MTRSKTKAAKSAENPEKLANHVDPFVLVYFEEDESLMYFNVINEQRKNQVKPHDSNPRLLFVKYNKTWFLGKIINRAGIEK